MPSYISQGTQRRAIIFSDRPLSPVTGRSRRKKPPVGNRNGEQCASVSRGGQTAGVHQLHGREITVSPRRRQQLREMLASGQAMRVSGHACPEAAPWPDEVGLRAPRPGRVTDEVGFAPGVSRCSKISWTVWQLSFLSSRDTKTRPPQCHPKPGPLFLASSCRPRPPHPAAHHLRLFCRRRGLPRLRETPPMMRS